LLWSLLAARSPPLMVRLADCGASVGAGVNSDAPYQGEPTPMPTQATEAVSRPKRQQKALVSAAKPSALAKTQRTSKIASPPPPAAHRTKKEGVLALLNRPDGATIPDLVEATGWQQHSVRGFLAGTVKKKLGLTLASSNDDGGLRRYRIVTRRGR